MTDINNIQPNDRETKKICLTFDDGPQLGTEEVLNVLEEIGAPAVFFLTGKNMQVDPVKQRELVERILDAGHQVANHTFTHFPAARPDYINTYGDLTDPIKEIKFKEYYEINERHFNLLMKDLQPLFPGFKLARLPGDGRFVKYNDCFTYVDATVQMGMAHVTWHFEFAPNGRMGHLKVLDWQGVDGVAAELDRYPKNNEIILFHDSHWLGFYSDLLRDLLSDLEENGYQFTQLDEEGKCIL